jgi:phosphatidate phosphatase APP1
MRKLGILLTRNPRTRQLFADVLQNYRLLAEAHTSASFPNPFFYVSNSEWNLYDDLVDFFRRRQLPTGVFLLKPLKTVFSFFKTTKRWSDSKLGRILQLLSTFPEQKFVLLGDNAQKDPSVYQSIVNKFPQRIFAVYIRNTREKNAKNSELVLSEIAKQGVHTCFFTSGKEAVIHARGIGLIER